MIVRSPFPSEDSRLGFPLAVGIAQPAHSRLAGELARAWSVPEELAGVPWSDLALAAELHDIGYAGEETKPTWNPRTGLPYSFTELPCALHLDVWRKGIEQVRVLSGYAALFVWRHFRHLLENHPLGETAEEKEKVSAFVAEQMQMEKRLTQFLQQRRETALVLSPEEIARQQQLVAQWDSLSLAICGAMPLPEKGPVRMRSASRSSERHTLVVEPWPFRVPELKWQAEAKFFPRRYGGQADLHASFAGAPVVPFDVLLVPGR